MDDLISGLDRPQSWSALTAETLLQALAEAIEAVPADDPDWLVPNRLLSRAFERVLAAPPTLPPVANPAFR